MHYYQHHIGDFIKATARLSDSQTMAYLRLLWMYYDSEKPLHPDSKILAFQIGASQDDVDLLLSSFFVLSVDGWRQTRCDKEIAEYRTFLDKKSAAGRASAERRKNSSATPVEQVFNECSTDVQLTTNHKPITNNQEIKNNIVNARGTRLSTDWELSEDQKQFCVKERPDLDPTKVSAGFKDYWISVAGAKGVKKDWDATWRNWVRNQKSQPTTVAKPSGDWWLNDRRVK